MRILLTGATGFLGPFLLDALRPIGAVTVLVRRPSVVLPPGVATVVGDLRDDDALARACAGVDAVVHAAAHIGLARRDARQLHHVNVAGTHALLTAAGNAGVARFVYVASIAALGEPGHGRPIQAEPEAGAAGGLDSRDIGTVYGRAKWAAMAAVESAARAGLPALTLLPASILGSGGWERPSQRQILVARRRMWVAPAGGTGYVAAADVAAAVVRTLTAARDDPAVAPGRRYLLVGESMPFRDYFTKATRAFGVPPPRWTVPHALMVVAGAAGELWAGFGGNPAITLDVARLTRHTLRYDGTPFPTAFPGFRYTPIDDVLRQAAAAWREQAQG